MVQTSQFKARSYEGDYMEAGKEAERIVIAWLKTRPKVIEVIDVRENPEFQHLDVDIMVRLLNGHTRLAEIKHDHYLGKSGNFLFELTRINHTAPTQKAVTLGWTGRSPADWLFYYAPQMKQVYWCELEKFRAAFQKYTSETRQAMQLERLDLVMTDRIKSTLNVLVPEGYCKGIFTVNTIPEAILTPPTLADTRKGSEPTAGESKADNSF
jgi:hypothetical protein